MIEEIREDDDDSKVMNFCKGCNDASEENCRKCNEEIERDMSKHPESCSCHDCHPDLYE